ncbi:helix-turn-helix transcriptional regulator [Streptomyces fructofermentans]|uniref:Helix-turn-helix transcriptional regulator n=1 Tax=Streptomyces fructofermentans TaxID=152141 RepID=A0A918KNK8_9ACTN|nr:LuxR family transcriptional regulator [Streptomyces fructofermentans]GGX69750.1 helix-turn-helix transcriptional regulator [Streptomyces fructofermentans]
MGDFAVRPLPQLLGRRDQLALLDDVLNGARAGKSGVLVLRGEAGIGKTALLDAVGVRAVGFRTTGVAGVESEMRLPFASLHQFCAPLLDRIQDLPAPQHDALSVAFGLKEGKAPNRFLVGLAVLGLLAGTAGDHPLLCRVDDAQWLDDDSMQVLAFVARRLMAEPVALLFALREPEGRQLTGLPGLVVEGLSEPDARALLASAVRVPFDPVVRDRIVAEARGNPMALLHLPNALTPAELAGGFWLSAGHPLESYIEDAFHQQFRALPQYSKQLVLTAAAEPTADIGLLWRAAALQSIPRDAAAPAETAGLVEFGIKVRFHHPLVRSAIYRKASEPDRRAAHRALAEATDSNLDPDRRAWHRAHATAQPDEDVASDLERSADRVRSRGGMAAASSFLQRAAQLTPDPVLRAPRALAAAQIEIEAGGSDQAHNMLAAAESCPLDPLQRARLERLRARLVFARVRGADAPGLLLEAAQRLVPLDTDLARDTLLEALGAVVFAGRLAEGPVQRKVAEAARTGRPPKMVRTVDVLLDGIASLIIDGFAASADLLKYALDAVREQQKSGPTEDERWLWLACPVAPGPLAPELWDDEAWHELGIGAVRIAREAGALAVLPMALNYQACFHTYAGDFATAAHLIDEANAISEATGSLPVSQTALLLGAWTEKEPQALEIIQTSVKQGSERGEGRTLGLAEYATALLYNGLGRTEEALAAATCACQYEDLGFFGLALVELVEAASRSGHPDIAAAALGKLTERTKAGGTPWALGTEAYCRALLSEGPEAEALYRTSIDHLERCRIAVYLARARLLYGEWLRRESRRQESRTHLSSAYEAFRVMGATSFAERALRELTATGAIAGKRAVGIDGNLTSQEAQIARLAADGHTNGEIAAQLFISPRTVEWHLGNVFAKLGVKSRRHLEGAFPAPPLDTGD